MTTDSPGSSLSAMQRAQVDDWLKQADRLIRAGRYLAADDLLQKVLAADPDNSTGHAYLDRIQFLIKQLSQRVGLTQDIQAEIRNYRDLALRRKSNQVSSLLINTQKLIDKGNFTKAAEHLNRALALDPENAYAKAVRLRLADAQQHTGGVAVASDQESKFCSILQESLRDGNPSEAQRAILLKMREELKISPQRADVLERETRNALYKNALHGIWSTGGLSAFSNESIESLRSKYEIARIDHSMIESALLREVRVNKIKGTVLLVEGDEESLLEMSARIRANFYAVIAAGSFGEALAILKSTIPDVVVCNVNFDTGSGGFDLYEYIRSSPPTQKLPFFFVASPLDRATMIIGKRLGVDEFFTKPIDYEIFFATIAGKLGRQPDRSPRLRRS